MEFRKTLQVTLLLAAGGIIAFFVLQNLDETLGVLARLDIVFLSASLAFGLLNALAFGYLFHLELVSAGSAPHSEVARSIGLFLTSQVIKYLPGKIWPLVYQSAALGNIPGSAGVIRANYGLTVLALSASMFVAGVCLVPTLPIISLSFLLIGILLIVLGNATLGVVITLGRRFLKEHRTGTEVGLPTLTKAQAGMLVLIVVLNTSAYIMLFAALNQEIYEALRFTAYMAIAWVVGTLTFIVPAGIGVREAVFISAAVWMGESGTALEQLGFAVIARFWQIAQDGVGALGYQIFLLARKRATD